MARIDITNKTELEGGWVFELKAESYDIEVGISKDYWVALTHKKKTPEQLLLKSFEFLLEREQASSILSRFELPVISDYFPQYEAVITAWSGVDE